jgi:hypothetical protein
MVLEVCEPEQRPTYGGGKDTRRNVIRGREPHDCTASACESGTQEPSEDSWTLWLATPQRGLSQSTGFVETTRRGAEGRSSMREKAVRHPHGGRTSANVGRPNCTAGLSISSLTSITQSLRSDTSIVRFALGIRHGLWK